MLSWAQLVSLLLSAPPDPLAWEEAFARLRGYAQTVLRSYPDHRLPGADELASEVLLRLIDPHSRSEIVLRALQATGAPEAYFTAAIRNAIIARLRRAQVEREALKKLGVQKQLELGGIREETPWFSTEDIENLMRELHRLDAQEKELLRLRFWKELPIAEIAKRLNASYSATAVRLFRLVRKLRAILAHRPDEHL